MADKSRVGDTDNQAKLVIKKWRWRVLFAGIIMAIVIFPLMNAKSLYLQKEAVKKSGAEKKLAATRVVSPSALARTTRVSALKVMVPVSGAVTIRVDEGPGTCDPQGRVKVTTTAGESFEDGPSLTIRRGKVPVGTKEEYRSLESSPVEMTCFNRTLL